LLKSNYTPVSLPGKGADVTPGDYRDSKSFQMIKNLNKQPTTTKTGIQNKIDTKAIKDFAAALNKVDNYQNNNKGLYSVIFDTKSQKDIVNEARSKRNLFNEQKGKAIKALPELQQTLAQLNNKINLSRAKRKELYNTAVHIRTLKPNQQQSAIKQMKQFTNFFKGKETVEQLEKKRKRLQVLLNNAKKLINE